MMKKCEKVIEEKFTSLLLLKSSQMTFNSCRLLKIFMIGIISNCLMKSFRKILSLWWEYSTGCFLQTPIFLTVRLKEVGIENKLFLSALLFYQPSSILKKCLYLLFCSFWLEWFNYILSVTSQIILCLSQSKYSLSAK